MATPINLTFYRIRNPLTGDLGGFAAVSQIVKLNKMFEEEYVAVLKDRVNYDIVKVAPNNYVFWIRIPSTGREKIIYDLVIDMESDNPNSFLNAKLKLWSNDPSFMFNYTYVLANNKNKQGVPDPLIPEYLIPKCSKLALTKAPDIRNPYGIWHIERYFIYAKYLVFYKGFLNPKNLDKAYNRRMDTNYIANTVLSQEDMFKRVKSAKKIEMKSVVNTDDIDLIK